MNIESSHKMPRSTDHAFDGHNGNNWITAPAA